jgi:hypothetical protein
MLPGVETIFSVFQYRYSKEDFHERKLQDLGQ